MQYANTPNGKTLPEPGLHGTCPQCDGEVISKCGEINVWHFAHRVAECDTWSEGETPWHVKWKTYFPPALTEVTMIRDGIKHRADVRLSTGKVLEFQHSTISPSEILNRNDFWGDVTWVFHIRQEDIYWERIHKSGVRAYSDKDNFHDEFRWRNYKRTLRGLDNFVLDPDNGSVMLVKKVFFGGHGANGTGRVLNKFTFLVDCLKLEKEWELTGEPKTFDVRNFTW